MTADDYVNFRFRDGSMALGVQRECFVVIERVTRIEKR